MTMQFTRRELLKVLSIGASAPLSWELALARDVPTERSAASPYRCEFTYPATQLVWDLDNTERGDPRRQSPTPHGEWYSERVRHKFGSWGPEPRHYLPPIGMDKWSVDWRRERVIAVASRFIGYGYQHHHIPDWDPPKGWPWKECCVGHNGKGFDCSNFTSFVYNQGFGIRMSSGIERQSNVHDALEGRGHTVTVRRVALPKEYETRQKVLRTGDLLYIRGREEGPIKHVVIWVGSVGRASSGVPLIMDSHGGGVDDDEGQPIPCGVHLRPFRENSWYNRCAGHAHRIFHDAES